MNKNSETYGNDFAKIEISRKKRPSVNQNVRFFRFLWYNDRKKLHGEKMKLRRSERMVVISNYLINHPYELTSLNTFAEKYESAKSSISEDIVIIKRAFEEMEIGNIETITGAGGGVIFTPSISDQESKEIVEDLCKQLSESDRILPGGYIYLSDLLSNPKILNRIGRIIAKAFRNK